MLPWDPQDDEQALSLVRGACAQLPSGSADFVYQNHEDAAEDHGSVGRSTLNLRWPSVAGLAAALAGGRCSLVSIVEEPADASESTVGGFPWLTFARSQKVEVLAGVGSRLLLSWPISCWAQCKVGGQRSLACVLQGCRLDI